MLPTTPKLVCPKCGPSQWVGSGGWYYCQTCRLCLSIWEFVNLPAPSDEPLNLPVVGRGDQKPLDQ